MSRATLASPLASEGETPQPDKNEQVYQELGWNAAVKPIFKYFIDFFFPYIQGPSLEILTFKQVSEKLKSI